MLINKYFNFWKMSETEHYENGNGITVRAFAIDQKGVKEKVFSACQISDGNSVTTHYFDRFADLIDAVKAVMFGIVVEEEEQFTECINQGQRDATILEMKKTRFRIGYDMPNAGWMEGWRTVTFIREGVKYYLPRS